MKPQILPPALALTILINQHIISAFSNTSKGLFICIQNKGNLELSWSWFGSCVSGGWPGAMFSVFPVLFFHSYLSGRCYSPCPVCFLTILARVLVNSTWSTLSHGCQYLDLDCSSSLIISDIAQCLPHYH